MNILQFSLLTNAGCAGGCKFCSLSIDSEANRETSTSPQDFQRAFEDAEAAGARLELVFPTVGANDRDVTNLLSDMQPIIKAFPHVELAINPGICTKRDFYDKLLEFGIHRYRNNLECSRRLFRELVPKRPLAQEVKLVSLHMAQEAGLKADTGWLCGLGENKDDIKDIVELMNIAKPDSITMNYFDPDERAEDFEYTTPSLATGLDMLNTVKHHFPETEITLGGAYELWLGENAEQHIPVSGKYVGRFLDHGLQEEAKQARKVSAC